MDQAVLNWLVPSIVSVIGFCFTYLQFRKQEKREKQKPIDEHRRNLYELCYAELELFTADKKCIFTREYMEILLKYKARIKLEASPSVIKEYKECWNIVKSALSDIDAFDKSNDPLQDEKNIEYVYDEISKKEYEKQYIDDQLIEAYKTKRNQYCLSSTRIVEYQEALKGLLNSMRSDFGCEAIGNL